MTPSETTDPTPGAAPVPGAAQVLAEIGTLLAAQRRRIKSRLLWHGAGVCLAALLFGLIAYYLTDRALDLPVAVRLLATGVLAAGFAGLAWRHVARPQRLDLDDPNVAIALEARFPALREQLISAVQLGSLVGAGEQAPNLRNQSPDMIARVVAEAVARSRAIPVDGLVTWRHASRVWAVAAVGLLVALPAALVRRDAVAVFVRRMLGADVDYPRLTSLRIELPPADQDFQIVRQGSRATLTMAAGGDLPVLVHVDGVVPREVFLAIDGGRGMPSQVATAARGNGRFRHVFRRVSDSFVFHARGGDDDRGDLLVEVTTVRPPRVGTIRAALTFPEYTGRPPIVQEGGSIEAIAGTAVQLEVAPLGEVAAGRLLFQESGQQIELAPLTVADDGGRRSMLSGKFTLTKSDRYQVELASREGLRSPQSASYPIIVLPDAPPSGQILLPQDDGLNVLLPAAVLPLRVLAKDDFSVRAIAADITVGDRQEPVRKELEAIAGRTQTVRTALYPLRGLLGDGVGVKEGESITLVVHLTDNRAPEAQTTKLPGRTLHVVGLSDLERRIAGHFRRVRGEVEKALELQRERHTRLTALRAEVSSLPAQELAAVLTALQVAQGRVHAMAGRVHAELMRSFNVHLFNPLDEGAQVGPALELFVRTHASPDDARALVPDYYRELASQRDSGRIGTLGKFLDRILGMNAAADRVADKLAPDCVQQLAAARGDSADLGARLQAASVLQEQIVAEFDGLLGRLDEWTEFQDVISTTRALKDNQSDVRSRTKSMRK